MQGSSTKQVAGKKASVQLSAMSKPKFLARSGIYPIAAILLNLAVVPSVNAAADEVRLSPAEPSAVCEVTRGLVLGGIGSTARWAEDRAEEDRLAVLGDAIELNALPAVVKCPDGKRRLSGRGGYGNFLDGFGISDDGSAAAISGGFQYTSLLGGGGVCYFVRRDTAWMPAGCVHTWES